MMYFAVLGKHKTISLTELQTCISMDDIHRYGDIVCFDTDARGYDDLQNLAGIIKYGKVISYNDLGDMIGGQMIGISDESLALALKKKYRCKRYKIIAVNHSDLELQKKGLELITWGDKDHLGVVSGYQAIELYTQIDFAKPSSGMQVGMMPSKLAHILLNLASGQQSFDQDMTVYDPFCGFGTTLMLANTLGIHAIGSDINITQTKLNLKWRKSHRYYRADRHMTVFRHDMYETLKHPLLHRVDMIVTEGRLGPILSHQTTDTQYQVYSDQVIQLYTSFIQHSTPYRIPTIVLTIPYYLQGPQDTITEAVTQSFYDAGYTGSWISQLYHRPRHLLARRIGIFHLQSPSSP